LDEEGGGGAVDAGTEREIGGGEKEADAHGEGEGPASSPEDFEERRRARRILSGRGKLSSASAGTPQ
jgi:hypothetical protein